MAHTRAVIRPKYRDCRLKTFKRGTLNGNRDAITTLKFVQDWDLDETGNWSSFKEDDDGNGSWNLEQTRSHNKVNEISGISESTGPSWIDPAYNRVGNTTTIPKPADPTGSFTATYDAWDHLVKLVEGANTVAEYAYDGRHFRIVSKSFTGGSLDETRHHFYTTGWQCIEDRVDSATTADRHWIWGVRYIDDLIMRDRDTDANGTFDERIYAMQDANWNVTALGLQTGAVVERFRYRDFGSSVPLSSTFTVRASSLYKFCIRFSACRFDINSGLVVVRRRTLHAESGRWIQRDHMRYVDGASLYAYAKSMPLVLTDPFGSRVVTCKCWCTHSDGGYWENTTINCQGLADTCCKRACHELGEENRHGIGCATCSFGGVWSYAPEYPDIPIPRRCNSERQNYEAAMYALLAAIASCTVINAACLFAIAAACKWVASAEEAYRNCLANEGVPQRDIDALIAPWVSDVCGAVPPW